MEIKNTNAVPSQKEGVSSDVTATHSCNDNSEAKDFYNIVKTRLLNVNEWESIAGLVSADFKLCDKDGEPVKRDPKKGDHFRIDIPGPGTVTGEGYDWVRVEAIDERSDSETENITITVRPATNPRNNRGDVAHFFSDTATSSFIAERNGNIITAAVKGRNEKPNVNTEKKVDTLRNSSVATAAVNGFSKIQWQGLVNGLVKAH